MDTTPKIALPNGTRGVAFQLLSDGRIILLCADNVMREVHPAVVDALASGRVAPGVWQLAAHYRTNPNVRGIVLPPGAINNLR